jgi:hypothetical protein
VGPTKSIIADINLLLKRRQASLDALGRVAWPDENLGAARRLWFMERRWRISRAAAITPCRNISIYS